MAATTAKAWATEAASSTIMPSGASGRLPFSPTRQAPARLAAKASRNAKLPEKNVRCRLSDAARSARSVNTRAPSARCGMAIPVFSQICARLNGPRFSKKRRSAMTCPWDLFLWSERRRHIEVDLQRRHLLVQLVDGVAGDVETTGGGEHHGLFVQDHVGATRLHQSLQDRTELGFHLLARQGEGVAHLLVL